MRRFSAIALLLTVLPFFGGFSEAGGKKDKDFTVKDQLTKDDPKDSKRGFASKVHVVHMTAGKVYTIDMISSEFDSYLRLEDAKGAQLDEDDDSGGNLNARIIFNCMKTGDYRVICTCFAEATGNFTLSVKANTSTVKNTNLHEALIGKTAPNFGGDFALNGKAVQLGELKGKVVLLSFWSVGTSSSTAALPKLRQWSKLYKDAGLEVVGLSFYTSDIGQHLGFDKATGHVTRLEEGTRADEQAMLKQFAAYHKLDYLLLTQTRDAAMKTYDDYAVNGLPQVVLIDRKGNVRMIRVGDVPQGASVIEGEIKKLLEEK